MKKFISILLLLATLVGVIACTKPNGDKNDGTTEANGTTNGTQVQTTDPGPDLPDYDGKGADFTFLVRLNSVAYNDLFVCGDETATDVASVAVIDRNRYAEDKFDITIKSMPSADPASIGYELTLVNDYQFDAMWECFTFMSPMAIEGFFVDFQTVPNIDLTQTYWAGDSLDELTIADKVFAVPSDISMVNLNGAKLLYFNKQILKDNNLEDPYALVKADEWTIEKFYSLITAAGVSNDVDGNDIYDRNDCFGFLATTGAGGDSTVFSLGAGIRFTEKDENDIPQLVINNNEKLIDFLTELREKVYINPEIAITYDKLAEGADISQYAHKWQWVRRTLFTNDQFLFTCEGIGVTADFVDMKSDYGIVPVPKFNEEQDRYYSYVDMYSTKMGIPITNPDLERTGIILEWLSWKSQELVLPAYYETTIKVRRFQDDTAKEMVDLVKNSMTYDVTDFFNLSVSSWVWWAFRDDRYSSYFASADQQLSTQLQESIDKMTNS